MIYLSGIQVGRILYVHCDVTRRGTRSVRGITDLAGAALSFRPSPLGG